MMNPTAIFASLTSVLPHAAALLAACAFVAATAVALAATARARVSSIRQGDRRDPVPAASVRPAARACPKPTRVLIVGAGARGRELAGAILDHPQLGYRVIGFVDDEPGMPGWDGIPILGGTCDIPSLVERHAVGEIMVAHAPSWHDLLMGQLVAAGRDDQVRVSSALGVREAMMGDLRLRQVGDIPLVALSGRRPSCAYRWAKRAFDIGFSALALLASAPLIGLLALLVKATSRGPAFFRQWRVGLGGREFTIYKLRTMVQDAESSSGPKLADPYDARVTPLGRLLRLTRLDEVPQFFNVLRGDMSVVGPRPERPEFVGGFLADIPGYAKRLAVRPGITGLAQVRGGYDTDVHTKLKYDWAYVYRQSTWLDVRILLSTARVVLLCAGQ
jgi:exopolysaccharide biosynthesis polyprenyl glycosylphosphotransferase